jgi:hypothetical protein
MIELTREQREALQMEQRPPRVRDPETNATYVLLESEVYDRVRKLFDADNDGLDDIYPHVMEVFGREGWDDPAMDVYDELDPRRQA